MILFSRELQRFISKSLALAEMLGLFLLFSAANKGHKGLKGLNAPTAQIFSHRRFAGKHTCATLGRGESSGGVSAVDRKVLNTAVEMARGGEPCKHDSAKLTTGGRRQRGREVSLCHVPPLQLVGGQDATATFVASSESNHKLSLYVSMI